MTIHIAHGDCREVLAEMESESIHCVVTSPPYWNLRDYEVVGQLGMEATLDEYIKTLVNVFHEVRRVLRKDGVVWLNIGDCYTGRRIVALGLKPKDLVMIPARLGLALQADGWWVRSDIIWAKPNPMPESVTDRPTSAYEHIFLLTRSAKYYYDAEAVREAESGGGHGGAKTPSTLVGRNAVTTQGGKLSSHLGMTLDKSGRNLRNVWNIATQPYTQAHFATFPVKLVEPCIKAGTSAKGCCADCGAPWVRVVERESAPTSVMTKTSNPNDDFVSSGGARKGGVRHGKGQKLQQWRNEHPSKTTGWSPSCPCNAVLDGGSPVPATVLDPFGGSGTVGLVAERLGRDAILIELNANYVAMAQTRIQAN